MSASMLFDISARDNASDDFLQVATAAERLKSELRELDGKDVRVKVKLDTPSGAEMTRLQRLSAALHEIDGKNARARVELDGVPDAKTASALRRTAKALKELDGQNAHAAYAVTGDLPNPRDLRAAARALKDLEQVGEIAIHISVTGAVEALAKVRELRTELKALPRETKTKVDVDVDKDGAVATRVAKLAGLLMAGGAAGTAAAAGLGSATAAVASLAGSLVSVVGVAPVAVGALAGLGLVGATLKIGLSGVGDALKAIGDPKKFAKAIADLSTEARGFAVAARDAAPAWGKVREQVQDNLFQGLTKDLKALSTTYLPVAQSGFKGIATELNGAARGVADFAKSGSAVRDVTGIFNNTTAAMAAARPAATNLLAAITDIAAVGSTRLPALGAGWAGVTAKFREFISEARQSGQLNQWIDAGVASAKQLGSVLGNVGSVAMSVYRAAKTAGADFLTTLERGTEAAAKFMRSGEGQTALVAFFREARSAVDALTPGLESAATTVAKFVQSFSSSGGLQAAGKAISDLVTAIAPLGATLGKLAGETLATLAGGASQLAGALAPVVSGVSGLVSALGPVAPLVLATVVAFKGFSTVGAMISGLGSSIAATSSKWGLYATAVTGSLKAGGAAETATRSLGTALSAVGKALPVVGIAVVALSFAYDQLTTSASEAATAVIRGETSIEQARSDAAAATDRQTTALGRFHEVQKNAKTPTDEFNQALREQEAALSPLELAQSRVAQAQKTYDDAVKSSGPTSAAAQAAAIALAGAQNNLTAAQQSAANAAKDHNTALRDQVNAASGVLGSMLQLDQALAQVSQSEKTANDAARQHGASSQEAAAAARQFVGDALAAAQAAGQQAEKQATAAGAVDAAAQGTRTYGATLLQLAANAQGPAQAALLGYIARLDSASLAALSAGAEASGLATKILTLPDGRTVKIAIDPETGKIISTQQLLDKMPAQKTITVNGNVVPVQTAVQQVLTAVQQGQATVTINGQSMPALEALRLVGEQAGLANATVNINGQTVPAMAALNGFIASVQSGNPMVNINGNELPATAVFQALVSTINTTPGQMPLTADPGPVIGSAAQARMAAEAEARMPINGEPAGVNAASAGAHAAANAPSTMPIGGAPAGANAASAGAHAAANAPSTMPIGAEPSAAHAASDAVHTAARAPSTMPIQGDPGGAWAAINSLPRVITAVYRIVKEFIGFADGGIYEPMASGGVVAKTSTGVPVRAFAGGGRDDGVGTYDGHRLRPMSGSRAAAVPPRSYRVVGDNQNVTEVYIPLNGSDASLEFTRFAAARQGYSLVPMMAPAPAQGGSVPPGRTDVAAAWQAGRRQQSAAVGGDGVRLDLSVLVAEVRALKGAVVGADSAGPVVAAVGRVERAIVGSRPNAAVSAQARRTEAELGRWG